MQEFEDVEKFETKAERMPSYTSLIRLIRRRLVLALIFALSLTYCAFSLLRNEKGSFNLDGDLDDIESMINDNNEDADDNVFAEELKASDKLWQVELLDQTINAESLDVLNLNESDVSTQSCRNSVQGRGLIVDEHGIVCARHEVLSNGCCSLKQKQITENEQTPSSLVNRERYSCKTCNSRGCCTIYEYCVSCCLHPSKPIQQIRNRKGTFSSSAKAKKNGERIDTHNLDRFQICLAACRTSSSSLRHENTYKDPLAKHCYARQMSKSHLKHRRNVNSLNNNGDNRAVVVTSSSVVMLLASFPSECQLSLEYRISYQTNSPNKSHVNINCLNPMLKLTQFPLLI